MANLRDELLKNMLKIQKDIIKKESKVETPRQNLVMEPKVSKKNEPNKIYSGPKTIRCRFCGNVVLAHLINQHNNEVHHTLQKSKQTLNQADNSTSSSNKIISRATKVIDGQKVIFTRRIVESQAENSPNPIPGKVVVTELPGNETVDLKFMSSYQLSTTKDFKMPDDWVARNYVANDSLKQVDITIGLDFGTSYTKVCVRFGDNHYIVDWNGISNFSDKHTLPSELSYLKDGSCQIGRSADAHLVVSSLKIPLLEKNTVDDTYQNALQYIALVLNYVRSWWFHHHANLSRNNALDWVVNIGCPSEQVEDNYWIIKYKKLVSEAWVKSFTNSNPIKLHEDNIAVIAEFVAEIASYTKSALRQADLHLLIDIGGGTVDIVTFNIHRNKNDEEIFPIFDSEVINLGTHYLMSDRIQKCAISDGEFQSSTVLSSQDFAKKYHQEYKKVQDIDSLFMEEIKIKVLKVLDFTKKNRYYLSPNWEKGIRTFICGGGSNSHIYTDAIARTNQRYNLSRINLPLPSNLNASQLNKEDFHRVSVAYGLSFDVMNLSNIIKKQDVEDAPREEQPLRASNTDFDDG